MQKIMGIDYGDARTGVALSDLMCSIVGSTQVVPSRNKQKAMEDIIRIAKENEVAQILVDYSLACQLTNAENVVGIVHTVLLNGIYRRIHIAAATVKVCSMDMDNQFLSRYLLSMDTGRICQPVMRVDDIELFCTCNNTGYN